MNPEKDNLYSRQIGVIGKDTMLKLSNLNLFLLYLDTLGIEIAKCLCLLGIKTLYVYDCRKISDVNKGRNYGLNKSNKGDIIGESIISYLKGLNIYVDIKYEIITDEILKEVDVVIQTKINSNGNVFNLNERCRNLNVKYILGTVIGLTGYIYNDFGEKHIVTDQNGEKHKLSYISKIERLDNSILLTLSDGDNNLTSGDLFKFQEPNIERIFKIKNIENNIFKIDFYYKIYKMLSLCNNICIYEEKEILIIKHKCLKELLYENNYPDILINLENKDITGIHKEIYEIISKPSNLLNSNYYPKHLVKGKHEFPIISCILGAIIAQEVVKITGKYIPLSQELLIDYTELYDKKNLYKSPTDKKKEDINNLLPKNIIKILEKLNIFLVGCGAIGCEYLKLFSMLNMGINKKSKITVTDLDTIELSNLNRQFLFRGEDIGKFKSSIAKNKILEFNNKMNIDDLIESVGKNSEKTFNRSFWEKQDLIVNALDNVESRQYIDNKCLIYNKPLFESGTLGSKCNIQVIIPKLTKSYSETQDPVEKLIPMCTIKNFPFKIEHCIEWALDIFNNYFNEVIKDFKELNKGSDNFKNYINLLDNDIIINNKLEILVDIIDTFNENNYKNIVKFANIVYNKIFISPVKELLELYPIDKLNEDETKFWTGNRLMPSLLIDNYKLDNFIEIFTEIFSKCINIEFNKEELLNYIKIYNKEYIDNISTDYDKNKDLKNANNNLLNKLLTFKININNKYTEQIFDKDDDTNNHINIITIIANIRANIYNIKEITNLDCKLIAGKIVPALSTTTSLVTGLSMMEIIKYIYNYYYLDYKKAKLQYKDTFINTAINLYLQSESQKATKIITGNYNNLMGCVIKANPEAFTNWDFINVNRRKHNIENISNLIVYLTKKYNIEINMLVCENMILYNSFNTVNINKTFLNIYNDLFKNKTEYLIMELSSFDNSGVPILTPKLIYLL